MESIVAGRVDVLASSTTSMSDRIQTNRSTLKRPNSAEQRWLSSRKARMKEMQTTVVVEAASPTDGTGRNYSSNMVSLMKRC